MERCGLDIGPVKGETKELYVTPWWQSTHDGEAGWAKKRPSGNETVTEYLLILYYYQMDIRNKNGMEIKNIPL